MSDMSMLQFFTRNWSAKTLAWLEYIDQVVQEGHDTHEGYIEWYEYCENRLRITNKDVFSRIYWRRRK